VRREGDGFAWCERALAPGPLAEAAERIGREAGIEGPYDTELALAVPALVRTLVERLEDGLALFVDYGFGRREYYHPQRREGTLMCHYRQHAHTDPFFLPGLQDITVHVDFTAVAEAALEVGGRLAGYVSQAGLLVDAGLLDLLARTPAEDASRYLPQAAAVQRLLSPAEMGELFKAMALLKGSATRDLRLPGFCGIDLSRTL
jgi:SAM-dependent MidA family methyltransferase